LFAKVFSIIKNLLLAGKTVQQIPRLFW